MYALHLFQYLTLWACDMADGKGECSLKLNLTINLGGLKFLPRYISDKDLVDFDWAWYWSWGHGEVQAAFLLLTYNP